jgi:hypothetical protein
MVEANLPLDDAQAAAFWPVYDRYEADLDDLNGRLAALITRYIGSFATMSDEQGKEIVEEYLALERERADLREKYAEPFAKALPGRKLARFFQIDNKIQAVRRFALAAEIPVIDE